MPRILILSNPRCGNNLLRNLLNLHPDFYIDEELLEGPIQGEPLVHVENALLQSSKQFVGFYCFPEQLLNHGILLTQLISHIGANVIIVLWRESVLETLTSFRIAKKTGKWFSFRLENLTLEQISISPQDIEQYYLERAEEWTQIAQQLASTEIQLIFIRFEDLIANPETEIDKIMSHLSWNKKNKIYVNSQRQNPAPLDEKISNWIEIPRHLRSLKLEVPKILFTKTPISKIPEIMEFGPEREPLMPPNGWTYRVASPYLPGKLKQNVVDALTSGQISSAGFWTRKLGEKLKKLFGVPVAQPCSNGFSALLLALQCAGIGPGDEVIMPSFTMIADPNAAYFLGATPIFADCASGDYNPSWTEILNMASPKTKAVIVAHTYGVPTANIQAIANECKERGWTLIEDISQVVGLKTVDGRTGKKTLLGSFGDFACASMYVNKLVHAGDGGFVLACDPSHGLKLTSLVNHGFTPSYHFVHFTPATNSKINGLGAAMACANLDDLEAVVSHRAFVARSYRSLLRACPLTLMPPCGPDDTPWVFGLHCKTKTERTSLRKFLAAHGIETRDYFFALHLQPAYSHLTEGKRLPNAEKLGSTGFYLPTYSNLSLEDIQYISGAVLAFFQKQGTDVRPTSSTGIEKPRRPTALSAVQISSDSYSVEVRDFSETGELLRSEMLDHPYIEAVRLGMEAQECMIHERWDLRHRFITRAENLVANGDPSILKYFAPIIAYFKSIQNFENHDIRPWVNINLKTEPYSAYLKINTTTDLETLKLLTWIVEETRPEIIWEIGSWLGCASALMASAGRKTGTLKKLYACDAFLWQTWMNHNIADELTLVPGQWFGFKFYENMKGYPEVSEVNWPYEISELPLELKGSGPQLIYLDITQNETDFEEIWKLIRPELIPNKTILVVNGIVLSSIQFFTRHSDELRSMAKPRTIAKAFLYVGKDEVKQETELQNEPDLTLMLPRKLNFLAEPGWDHHHNDLFRSAIKLLRYKLHDETASVLFSSAVEENLCDIPGPFLKNPWIGIIHSVPNYPEYFYPPDLQRLCSPAYAKVMKNCKGLFTLTQFQAKYLRHNLPREMCFPIQPLVYPMETEISGFQLESTVINAWENGDTIDLVMIGSFARDFEYFFSVQVPSNIQKAILASDEASQTAVKLAQDQGQGQISNVKIIPRLNSDKYESLLKRCIPFISLKYDGAANTLVVECIQRNLPIVVPDTESCIEYFGPSYPLIYDRKKITLEVVTLKNIRAGISYLQQMDKTKFLQETFMNSVLEGSVLLSLPGIPKSQESAILDQTPNPVPQFPVFDLTVSICSYKRTHNLDRILKSFCEAQDYEGNFEIIVWNNNESRSGVVQTICEPYLGRSNPAVTLITSFTNYFCSVRFAMPALMKSNTLIICDDDVFPEPNFLSFFISAHRDHPNDVLCVRGHKFYDHKLDIENPMRTWHEYENLQFCADESPESFIHFAHADACLVTKKALLEVSSIEMPYPSFVLVDDYWMSFVLNHYFGRKLRKLSTAHEAPLTRSKDSDTLNLALYTRPEVQDARIQLYIYHMIKGWPTWPTSLPNSRGSELKSEKAKFWEQTHAGYNISHRIDATGIATLVQTGVDCVRIGAVGVGREIEHEFSGFLENPELQIETLQNVVSVLAKNGIFVVITLERKLASEKIWKLIAEAFVNYANVVGYDLINEPFLPSEEELHWNEIHQRNEGEMSELMLNYVKMIKAIREHDVGTPIVIESSFWGHIDTLSKIPVEMLIEVDPDLVFSFHFYEPMLLTQRDLNKGRYKFPGVIPVYEDVEGSEMIEWSPESVHQKLSEAVTWAENHGVKIFLGEFGICRDIEGAHEYLSAIFNCIRELDLTGFLFSFRDDDWDAMDYELGTDYANMNVERKWNTNILMKTVLSGITAINQKLLSRESTKTVLQLKSQN